jgi:hypothetical protein
LIKNQLTECKFFSDIGSLIEIQSITGEFEFNKSILKNQVLNLMIYDENYLSVLNIPLMKYLKLLVCGKLKSYQLEPW